MTGEYIHKNTQEIIDSAKTLNLFRMGIRPCYLTDRPALPLSYSLLIIRDFIYVLIRNASTLIFSRISDYPGTDIGRRSVVLSASGTGISNKV